MYYYTKWWIDKQETFPFDERIKINDCWEESFNVRTSNIRPEDDALEIDRSFSRRPMKIYRAYPSVFSERLELIDNRYEDKDRIEYSLLLFFTLSEWDEVGRILWSQQRHRRSSSICLFVQSTNENQLNSFEKFNFPNHLSFVIHYNSVILTKKDS